jgi:hypothetical protein
MQVRNIAIAFALAAGLGVCQTPNDKPADNTKVFGAKPPKEDKSKIRSVTGFVKDKDENPVAGATVYLKNLRTGKQRALAAGPNGAYRFDDLNTMIDYELRAAKGKLTSPTKLLSNFDTRRSPVMNLTLEPPAPSAAK